MMKLTSLSPALLQPLDRIQAAGLGKTPNQANQAFQALTQSLAAGDTSSAQSSFADLKKLLQSAGSIGAANSLQNEFALIGKDLSSGNLAAAQQDLQQLGNDAQATIQKSHGGFPGLPVRLPGGPLYQAGLSAAKSIGHMLT